MQRSNFSFYRLSMSALLVCSLQATGCMSMIGFPTGDKEKSLDELTSDSPDMADLVGKYTHPIGMDFIKVESIALVTGLRGTGEDPPPTPQRAAILGEMKQRQVDNPEKVLASTDTAIALCRATLRPGIQEGDRIDIEVQTPMRSETTSLRGGWMLPTRLTPLAVLGNQIRSGHIMAVAEGAILVDPSAVSKDDEAKATRGRILGGGVATKSRKLGLVIDDRYKSYNMTLRISDAINKRFHVRIDGHKQGAAISKTPELVEISVHDRYRDNVSRYMRVIRSVAVGETTRNRIRRMELLADQILDPITTARAALELEAIGNDEAVALLEKALESPETDVRFYAAEALAYLDKTTSVDVLAAMAKNEPAFRVNSLAALSAMDDLMAYEALRELLSSASAETRYGAFRALWAMNSSDPFVAGEAMSGFSFHVLPVAGPPMIHVTNSYRPELVLFGTQEPLKLPLLAESASGILVNGMYGDQLTVSRFDANGETGQRVIDPTVEELVRAIVDLGGTYPDVVQTLQKVKEQGSLPTRLAVDALPKSGRAFKRAEADETESDDEGSFDLATPLPDLFGRRS